MNFKRKQEASTHHGSGSRQSDSFGPCAMPAGANRRGAHPSGSRGGDKTMRMPAKLATVALAALGTLAATLALTAAPAGALLYHRYETQIPGAGAMTVAGGNLLVDESSRLAEYDASSDALLAQLSPSSLGLPNLAGVAAGLTGGETQIYAQAGEGVAVLGV